MAQEFLIIDKSILPEYFEAVLKAKSLVEDENENVSAACKATGISRSTFYKYKDKIFKASSTYGKKAIISLKTADERGVLSSVMNAVYSFGANVVSINQAIPIKGVAVITLTIDVAEANADTKAIVETLKQIKNVKSANVIAIE